MILLDSYMYGRLAIPPLNIVLYNIFSEHGPDLYGTSPWTFYFLNGFLNFNVVYPLALAVLPAILVTIRVRPIRSQTVPVWLALVPLYAWILIFFTQPHKVSLSPVDFARDRRAGSDYLAVCYPTLISVMKFV